MKRSFLFILAAALPVCTMPFAVVASRAPAQILFIHSDSPDPQHGQRAEIKTFIGRISKYGPRFVLEDFSMRTLYQLDDQQKAEKYQGKNVRVVGTLDAENNVIHVQSIEEAV